MLHLRDETELLICDNIIKINKDGCQLNIETLTDGMTEYWLNRGYRIDNSLYEKLIVDYNQSHDAFLTKWK
ncbi:MAG TPA: hypothetical protein VK787_07320 [Puia sp.]|nr:hypothetical protein [Puia sp.]